MSNDRDMRESGMTNLEIDEDAFVEGRKSAKRDSEKYQLMK